MHVSSNWFVKSKLELHELPRGPAIAGIETTNQSTADYKYLLQWATTIHARQRVQLRDNLL